MKDLGAKGNFAFDFLYYCFPFQVKYYQFNHVLLGILYTIISILNVKKAKSYFRSHDSRQTLELVFIAFLSTKEHREGIQGYPILSTPEKLVRKVMLMAEICLKLVSE